MSVQTDASKMRKRVAPHEIVEKKGTWIQKKELDELVAQANGISVRRANERITKDVLLRREKRPDGRVFYGLKTWPFKEVVKVSGFFMQEAWKKLEEISNQNVYGNPWNAYQQLCDLIAMLPEPTKNNLKPALEKAIIDMHDIADPSLIRKRRVYYYTSNPLERTIMRRHVVRELLGKVSSALHSLVSAVG